MGYWQLLALGLTENSAMMVTGAWIAVLFIAQFYNLKLQCDQLKGISSQMIYNHGSLPEKLSKIIAAFVSGFKGK